MNKDKLSYYASYVAIACGILILSLRFIAHEGSNGSTIMGFIFIVIGVIGLRRFRNNN